ncbi:MAG: VWA domain-containing protein [Bacteroidia bacterium]|nr:VWA domain-containing protein [Bacteroidia bacterium]
MGLAWMGGRVRLFVGYGPSQRRLSSWRAFFPLWGVAISAALATVAVSAPHLHLTRESLVLPDTWVLWDISQSMRERDLSPDRQRFALDQVVSALEAAPIQRIGLVVFSAEAYAVLPLTTDKEAFLFSLRQSVRLDMGEGTNLAAAIETALALAEPSQQCLIVSDGAHNIPETPALSELAQVAQQRGIRLHTFLVGREGPQLFPAALQLLSQTTGGSYQEGGFRLDPLLIAAEYPQTYPLAPYLWIAAIGVGLAVLGGMSLGGWFSVLTA